MDISVRNEYNILLQTMARPKSVYVSIQKIQKVMNLSIQRVRQTSLRCEVALEPRRIMERVLIYFVIVV